MSAAVPQAAEATSGQLVAHLGECALYCVDQDHYDLFAPNNGYSQAWLRHHLPSGDWFTEWDGSGDSLLLHLSR